MAGSKRSKDPFDASYNPPAKNRRVRFNEKQKVEDTDFEINHEKSLEPARHRRGAVKTDAYVSDDEEAGGGGYSSGSDNEDDDQDAGKGKDTADIDMFSDNPEASKKKTGRMNMSQIEGQELDSRNDDDLDDENEPGKTKIMAFNMREEMEEGSFDQQGNYIRSKKDPDAFHDKWMEGISRKEMARAQEAQEKRQRDEVEKEAVRQADMPQTKSGLYRELVELLSPSENAREALTKLSGSSKKVPAWKQKLMAKKKTAAAPPTPQLSEAEETARKAKVERITELTDQLMGLGDFDAYDHTFEHMVNHLRNEKEVPENWLPASLSRSS